jgi:protein-L-isoaspartate(D-aspartate) O-methyltransferase
MLREDRERMVATQIEARGITDPLVLDAMRIVPRERFVPTSLAKFAYDDEGDGSLGWAEHAPYDAILVTAGGPRVPKALLHQLAVGGRLVMPIGGATRIQRLVRVTRTDVREYEYEDLEEVAFVPLIGAEGWPEEGVASCTSTF